jgi:hypothetical protein
MSQLHTFAVCSSLLLSLAGSSVGQTPAASPSSAATARVPVLVELFTSEGCSSCPPADALLARFQHEQPVGSADIIVLEEHVDYWDRDGWHDRFSSAQFTDRQTEYESKLNVASAYTPQMVVDGKIQFVGNDAVHALRAISDASLATKLGLTLAPPVVNGHRVSSAVTTSSAQPVPPGGDIYVVLVDLKDETSVRDGENKGRQLQHVSVVRSMQRIASTKQLGTKPVAFAVTIPDDEKPSQMRLIVFAQQSGQRGVFGVAEAPLTP